MRTAINIAGTTFGRLTVLRRSPCKRGSIWSCRCSCGNLVDVASGSIRSGRTKSCGCLQSENRIKRNTKHGLYGTPEHRSWQKMIRRCTDKKDSRYPRYGGRGIEVCKEWLDFKVFLADMGNKPSSEHTIERKNSNLGYSKQNCEWATQKTQQRNRCNNHLVSFRGRQMSLSEAAESAGLNYMTVWGRIKSGWVVSRALTQPARRSGR